MDSDQSTALACPACGEEWRVLPQAAPLAGFQPVQYRCRKCDTWWILVYKVSLGRGVRWSVVAIVKSKGRHPERLREALRQVAELDEDLIELTVILFSSKPGYSGGETLGPSSPE